MLPVVHVRNQARKTIASPRYRTVADSLLLFEIVALKHGDWTVRNRYDVRRRTVLASHVFGRALPAGNEKPMLSNVR